MVTARLAGGQTVTLRTQDYRRTVTVTAGHVTR
jgi:hypothetical protein